MYSSTKTVLIKHGGPVSDKLRYVGQWDGVDIYTTAPRTTIWMWPFGIFLLICELLRWIPLLLSYEAQRYYGIWLWSKVLKGVGWLLNVPEDKT
ncbi:hypothetical protein M0R72_06470 [Candidatus Pacearchaeota archaeon]|jgi:hypothetical protein|nr:hypothetical protein [Candidatus Pacearchaeota archaeon]